MGGLVRYFIPNKMKLLKRALKAGADPNFEDGWATPICQAYTLEIIQLLLNYGADPQKSKFSNLNHIVEYYLEEKKYKPIPSTNKEWHSKTNKPSSITDEKWYSEACEAAKLVKALGRIYADIHDIEVSEFFGEEKLWAELEKLLKLIRRKLVAADRRPR